MAEGGVSRSLIVGGRDYEEEKDHSEKGGGVVGGVLSAVAFVFALVPNWFWGFLFGAAFVLGVVFGVDLRALTALMVVGIVWMLTMGVHHSRRVRRGVKTSALRSGYKAYDTLAGIELNPLGKNGRI